jgi:Arc/MetJ-type ribon-helix-helix transcriptional regulator
MAQKVTISIPVELKKKIDEFLEESKPEFKDVEDFILFLLTEFLSDEEEPEEDELLEKRLRALGYIE